MLCYALLVQEVLCELHEMEANEVWPARHAAPLSAALAPLADPDTPSHASSSSYADAYGAAMAAAVATLLPYRYNALAAIAHVRSKQQQQQQGGPTPAPRAPHDA